MMNNDKGKHNDIPHSLTLYVVFSILVVLIYTIVELIVSTVSGISHDTLTTCVYGFFAGEVVVCGLIKIFKLKNKDDNCITELLNTNEFREG